MNTCPHCGASIGEHARFCIACMTPLNEMRVISTYLPTRRRWLPVAAAVLVFALVAGVLWLWPETTPSISETVKSGELSNTDVGETVFENNEANTDHSGMSTDDDQRVSASQGETTTNKGKTETTGKENSTTSYKGEVIITGTGELTTSKGKTTTSSNKITTTASKSKTATTSKGETTTSSKSKTATTSKGEATTNRENSVITNAIYLFREARAGDDFSVSANLENAVVITGVSRPATNGVYIIPETLDGKRVIAIMSNAFCAADIKDTVKTVVVPATVRTIWNYAFANCYQLTNIYFLGEAVYTESDAFADPAKRIGTLTIHSSASCTDRALRYYKNAAYRYHALYKELSDAEIEALYDGGGQ